MLCELHPADEWLFIAPGLHFLEGLLRLQPHVIGLDLLGVAAAVLRPSLVEVVLEDAPKLLDGIQIGTRRRLVEDAKTSLQELVHDDVAVMIGGTIQNDDGILGVKGEVEDFRLDEVGVGLRVVAFPRHVVPPGSLLVRDHPLQIHPCPLATFIHILHEFDFELVFIMHPGLRRRLPGFTGGLIQIQDLPAFLDEGVELQHEFGLQLQLVDVAVVVAHDIRYYAPAAAVPEVPLPQGVWTNMRGFSTEAAKTSAVVLVQGADELTVDDLRPLHQIQGLPPPQVFQQVLLVLVQHRRMPQRRIFQGVPQDAVDVALIDLLRSCITRKTSGFDSG